MKRKILRITSILLFLSILSVVVIGCAENIADDDTNTTTADSINETEGETERSQTKDSLPNDLNFEGAEYRMLIRGDYFNAEFYAEEASGDIVEDAIYNRNLSIEERLNIDYELIQRGTSADYGKELNSIRVDITSDNDAYDVIAGYSVHIVTMMSEGLFYNLNEVEYLDFSQPWWTQSIQDEMTFNGSVYFMTGDICMTTTSKAICMYFNKTVAERYNISELYTTVNDNNWTFEKYKSTIANIYEDVNGNGKKDDNDAFGTAMTPYNSVDAFIPAFRQNITEMGEDGFPVLAFNNNRMVSIVETIYSLMYETQSVHVPRNSLEDQATCEKIFMDDRALFMLFEFTACDRLREMKSDFGIIPYPKFDSLQEKYGTYMQDGHTLLCIPITCTRLDLTGAATEALAAESYRRVTPAYFEVALQIKYSRDDESIQTLQLIKDSIKYNFGYVYLSNAFWCLRSLMNTGSTGSKDFASFYARNEKAFQKTLDKMIEKYQESV